ncbi:rhodanese-like domain-containing protein [Acidocella sp.]|uniref:rhodanese-like domain-containing protein n=1 Tax=Acidocella sp. TaxID=50710 RepID=UPI003D086A6C
MSTAPQSTSFTLFQPGTLQDALTANSVILVDVREPGEFEAARIEGAVNLPLSCFDPAALPAGDVVLLCGVGKRSRLAASLCERAGVPVSGHLQGGLAAWMEAGLPVLRR